MYKHVILVSAGLLATVWPMDAFQLETTRLASYHNPVETRAMVNFYANPLLLDGKPLDVTFFSTSSRGRLTVVAGNPAAEEATRIPFRVYLKRNGEKMPYSVVDSDADAQAVDLDLVMAMAKAGDWLVIEPIREADAGARRTILLKPILNWLFPMQGRGKC